MSCLTIIMFNIALGIILEGRINACTKLLFCSSNNWKRVVFKTIYASLNFDAHCKSKRIIKTIVFINVYTYFLPVLPPSEIFHSV